MGITFIITQQRKVLGFYVKIHVSSHLIKIKRTVEICIYTPVTAARNTVKT